MKKTSIPSLVFGMCLLAIGGTALSGCSYNSKSWVKYNEEIDLLTSTDKSLFLNAVQSTLESSPAKKAVPWTNSKGDVAGTVMPVRTIQKHSGVFCRVYDATFNGNKEAGVSRAAACRNSVGIWEIIKPTEIGN